MKIQFFWVAAMVSAIPLLTLSCTHKPYHPTKSEREWSADHKECEEWTRSGIRREPDTYDSYDEMKMIKACMKQKGWQWQRTDLFRFEKEPTE